MNNPPAPAAHAGHELAAPTMVFDLATLEADLRREDAGSGRGHTAKTLAKHADLRIVMVAMKAGSSLKEHHTEARFSLQTLSGKVRVHIAGETVELGVGGLLVVDKMLAHDVEALEDSAFLLSLFWPRA